MDSDLLVIVIVLMLLVSSSACAAAVFYYHSTNENTDPSGNTNPIENTDPSGNTDPIENTDPSGNTNPIENTDPSGNTNPIENTDPSGNTNPIENTDPSGNTNPIENTDPGEILYECTGTWEAVDECTGECGSQQRQVFRNPGNRGTCDARDGDTRAVDCDCEERDCVGEWRPQQDGREMYHVTVTAQKGGAPCEAAHGDTRPCAWSDWGACEWSSTDACDSVGTRTRTQLNGCNGTETVQWNSLRATPDKPKCEAGRWVPTPDAQCEPLAAYDAQCGSTGIKTYARYQLTNSDTACVLPDEQRDHCTLPACVVSSPSVGYYSNGHTKCPADREITTKSECEDIAKGYRRLIEFNTEYYGKCTRLNDAIYWNNSDTIRYHSNDNFEVFCKGAPELPDHTLYE
jgi:hypothetical protein